MCSPLDVVPVHHKVTHNTAFHQASLTIVDKKGILTTEFLLKLLDLKSDFTLTLGYLNPSLNNLYRGSVRVECLTQKKQHNDLASLKPRPL